MELCGVGLHFGGLRWRSKLQEGSDSTLPAWSLPQVRVPKDKVRVALSTPPYTRAVVCWTVAKAFDWKQDPAQVCSPSVFTFFMLSRWIFL